MTVELYIGKDPQGRIWEPDFTHEANAAIRIIGSAWRAFHASRELYLLAFNLHSPNIDLLVISERGIGLLEMKAHHGLIRIAPDGLWTADGEKMLGYKAVAGRDRPGVSYRNPHDQVQRQGDQLQERLLPIMREQYPELSRRKRRNLRMQSCVCFTNPEVDLTELRKSVADWCRDRLRPWESDFSVIVPAEVPEWISALRFEVKKIDRPPYYPFRLETAKQRPLLMQLFELDRWKAVERMLPIHRYGRLQQMRGDRIVAAFSLWEEETFLGRDHTRCTIVVPEQYTKVSRMHAVIRREAEEIVLEDLHSHNGTFLDGRLIDGKVVLRDGAVLSLGGAGGSERESRYIFQLIEQHPEDLDTTENGTHPQKPFSGNAGGAVHRPGSQSGRTRDGGRR
jgi:hypothetical protein